MMRASDEDRRGENTSCSIGRRHGDQQRADAHQGDRQRQPRLAAAVVGVDTHDPRPDRPHHKADGEDRGGVQQLAVASPLGKKTGAK